MTTPVEPVHGRPVRLGDRIGPELIAAALVLVLVLGGVATYMAAGPVRSDESLEPSPTAESPAAGDLAGGSGAIAGGSSRPSVGPGASRPNASASSSAAPSAPLVRAAWASTASLLLGADSRLIVRREALRAILAKKPKTAADLAREMRATSAEIQVALGSIRVLDAAGAPGDLVDRLMTPHQAAADAALEALSHPIDDVAGYRTRSKKVVTSLEKLEILMRNLATTAGLPDPFAAQ